MTEWYVRISALILTELLTLNLSFEPEDLRLNLLTEINQNILDALNTIYIYDLKENDS
jgi:hypothetical protein